MYILLTVILCLVLCFGLIYPLWDFATASPDTYTYLILIAAFLLIIFLIVRKILRTYRSIQEPQGKKRYVIQLILRTATLILTVCMSVFAIYFVINAQRLIALLIAAAGCAAVTVLVKVRKRITDA